MDRRKFISALGLGVGAAALAGCAPKECSAPQGEDSGAPAVPRGQRYEWKMVTTWPKNYPALGSGANRFARRVQEMTAGRIKIRVYGAQELVPAMEVFDAVRQGGAELGHGASYYWKGKHPATPFFTSVPFGMTAQEMNGWLHQGEGQSLWDELYAGFGLKPFACGNTGAQMGGWFNKKINTLDDLRGLKVRMPGLGGEVLGRVGALPVQMPGGEVYGAMQSGALDAAEWVGPYNDLTFAMHRVAKYYYYPGWQEPAGTVELIINKRIWDGLPADLQAILRTAAQAENQQVLDEYTARNSTALNELVERHGVELRRFPDEVLEALRDASEAHIQALVEGNKMAEKISRSYQQFQQQAEAFTTIAEQAFLEARSARSL